MKLKRIRRNIVKEESENAENKLLIVIAILLKLKKAKNKRIWSQLRALTLASFAYPIMALSLFTKRAGVDLTIIVIMGALIIGMRWVSFFYRLDGSKKRRIKDALNNFRIKKLYQGSFVMQVTSLIVGFCYSYFLGIDAVLFISLTVIVLMLFHNAISKYRVNSGYFGNNEYEARQIMEFIVSQKDDIDFHDNDGKPLKLNPRAAKESDFEVSIDLDRLLGHKQKM